MKKYISLQQSNHDKRKGFFWGGGVIFFKLQTKGMRDLQLVDYPPPPQTKKNKNQKTEQGITNKQTAK